jgi:peptidoglycan hydrolase-like protein with peptidoglycan-binding domain
MTDFNKLIVTLGIAVLGSAAVAGGTKSSMSDTQNSSYQNIVEAQRALNNEGHALLIDGKMGPNTKAALREYQRDENLAVTGTLDTETLDSLGLTQGRVPASIDEPGVDSTIEDMETTPEGMRNSPNDFHSIPAN